VGGWSKSSEKCITQFVKAPKAFLDWESYDKSQLENKIFKKKPNKQRLKFQFYNHIDNKSLYLIQTEYSIATFKDFKPKT